MSSLATRADFVDPDIRPFWTALATRFAQTDDPASVKSIRIKLEGSGRAIAAGWLSNTYRGSLRPDASGNISISVTHLLRAFGITPVQLYEITNEITGINRDEVLDRKQLEKDRIELWSRAAELLPDTPRLVTQLRAAGVNRENIGRARKLVEALARARCLVPLSRPVHLARLAQNCAGDPHYFDLNDDGNGSRLVQMATEILEIQTPSTPLEERQALAGLGVIAERFSNTVIAMNIDAVGDGPTDRAIRLAKEDRRVLNLNLHDLTQAPPQLVPGEHWLVVENPSVIEEAVFRAPERAIVCTSGAFTAVDHALLSLADQYGIVLTYSGDLDAGGVATARTATRYKAGIALMNQDTADAARAVGPLTNLPEAVPALRETSTIPTAAEISANGWAVFQEHPLILDLLLGRDPHDPLAPPREARGGPMPHLSPTQSPSSGGFGPASPAI